MNTTVDKYKMLGYSVIEHTNRVALIYNQERVRLLVIKDCKIQVDTDKDFYSRVNEIHLRSVGITMEISITYTGKDCRYTHTFMVDSYSNIVETNKEKCLIEDDLHLIGHDNLKIMIQNKTNNSKTVFDNYKVLPKNVESICSVNETCILFGTIYINTVTRAITELGSIIQIGNYLVCGNNLNNLSGRIIENVSHVIDGKDGKLYVVACYSESKESDFMLQTYTDGERYRNLIVNLKRNIPRTLFMQTVNQIISCIR